MPATRASNSDKHLGLPDKPRTRRSSAQVQADAAAKVAAVKQKADEKASKRQSLASMEDKRATEVQEKKKRVYTPAKKSQQGKNKPKAIEPQEVPEVKPQDEEQVESNVEPKKPVIKGQPYRKEVRHSDDSEVELVWTSGTEWETDSDQSPGSPFVFESQIEGTIMDPVLYPELLLPFKGTPPKRIRKKTKEKNKEARQAIRGLREFVPVPEEVGAESSPVIVKHGDNKKRSKKGRDDDNRDIFSPGVNDGYLQAVENLSWQSGTTSTLKSTTSSVSAPSTDIKGGHGKAPRRSAREDVRHLAGNEEENAPPPTVLPLPKTVGLTRATTTTKASRQAAEKDIMTDIGSEEGLPDHLSLLRKMDETVKVKQNVRGLPMIVEVMQDEISSLTESDEEGVLVSALPVLDGSPAPATSRKAHGLPPMNVQTKKTKGAIASTSRQLEKRKADDLSDEDAVLDHSQTKKAKGTSHHKLASASDSTSRKRTADDAGEDPTNTSGVARKKPRPKPTGVALQQRNAAMAPKAPHSPHPAKTFMTPYSARRFHGSPIIITSDDEDLRVHDSRGHSRGLGKPARSAIVAKKVKPPAFKLEAVDEDERIGCFEGDEEAEHQAALASPPKIRVRPTSEGMVKRVTGPSKTLQLPTQKGKYLEIDVKEEEVDGDLREASIEPQAGQRHEEKGKGKEKAKAGEKEKEKKQQRTLDMLPFQVRKVWPQFAQSFEYWAACQKQPFDLDDDDVVNAVQSIHDGICTDLEDIVFTIDSHTVKQCKQRFSTYKNMMSRAATLIVDAHFNTRANQERFTSMAERTKYCTEQLHCHNFIFGIRKPRSGTFMSKEVLSVFANHYQRMRSSPGPAMLESFDELYPIGGLILAATALYRAYDLYSEKRYEFVQEPNALLLPKKVRIIPQTNPNTGTNKDTSTFFSEDKYGEAAKVYATFVDGKLMTDLEKLESILDAAEVESKKYFRPTSIVRTQSAVTWREAIPPLLGSSP